MDLGLPKEKVFLTPNGVNLDLFRPLDQERCRAELGLEEEGPIMVWAGRLAPEKGVGDLIKAAPFILEGHPRTRLILIGQGPLLGELTELCSRLDLEGAVELRPAVPRQELALWYNAADLVCLPSLREGRPNTLLEALACGRPILATAVGGVPEIIENGRTGRLVEPGHPQALGRAAAELLNRPEALAQMGRAGPKALEEMGLTWAEAAKKVREVYTQVLERREKRAGEARLIGRPWTLWLAAAWAAVVSGIFLVRYWRILDVGYGISDKLGQEGWGGILARWLGF
jgi:glycosyltransferase involved in cell wall biosynthesis